MATHSSVSTPVWKIPGKEEPGMIQSIGLQSVGFEHGWATSLSLSGGSAGKESVCNVGDLGSIPELERPVREGNSYPLQYSGLAKSMG